MKIYLYNREVIEVSEGLGRSISRTIQRYKHVSEPGFHRFKYKKEQVLIKTKDIVAII